MWILIVLTSHDQLGDTGTKTGFWLEELAAPYYVLKEAGAAITLASPKGGQPPLDPKSDLPENQTELTKRFHTDTAAQAELANTKKLADVSADDFDAVFYPGGHGPMWDMPDNATSIALLEAFVKADKPVGAVCHAPVALVNVRGKDGEYLVKGKRVTGFANDEEEAVSLTAVVPFLLEDRLRERGGIYSKAAKWAPYVQVDGQLVTGQNPASSGPGAAELLKLLRSVAGTTGTSGADMTGTLEADVTIRARVENLYKMITSALLKNDDISQGLTPEVQEELGLWVNITSSLVTMDKESKPRSADKWFHKLEERFGGYNVDPEDILGRAELAIQLLLNKPVASLRLVQELRYEIRNDLSWNGGPLQRALMDLTGGSTSMAVALGALCTTMIGLPILSYLLASGHTNSAGSSYVILLHSKIVAGTAIPAFLGAIVSILARLQDFEKSRNTDLKLSFLTAFFKPYIGMITGLFMVSALAIRIGQVGADITFVPPGQESAAEWPGHKVLYFLYVVGFLSGFSERLAADFVGMTEQRLGGQSRAGFASSGAR
jgi:putative intracellular protease/amidase